MNRTQVSQERWQEAQAAELQYWLDQGPDADDWNTWWFEQFDAYRSVPWGKVGSLLEVGCGPFARNLRHIIDLYGGHRRMGLNDPLLFHYAANRKYVRKIIESGALANGEPLESMQWLVSWEALICINVLDHVQDVSECFQRMSEALWHGGYLILGQELTNEEDCQRSPDNLTDVKHPILMDYAALLPYLQPYETVFQKTLLRDEGRNPKAHYSTLLFIGKKVK